MSSNMSCDIPGFYRDPQTGRYFRITNHTPKPDSIRKMESEKLKEKNLQTNKTLRKLNMKKCSSYNANIVKMICFQESGFTANCNYNEEVVRLKTRQLESTNELCVDKSEFNAFECKFIRGGKNDLIGIWQDRNGSEAIWEVKFIYKDACTKSSKTQPVVSELYTFSPFKAPMAVSDICDASFKKQSSFFYVGNSFESLSIIRIDTKNRIGRPNTSFSKQITIKRAIWSCACNIYSERFAAGTENGCYIGNCGLDFSYKHVPGKVYSVEFSKSGNVLYCGQHKGELVVFDIRAPQLVRKNYGIGSIQETHLLDNEHSIIICGLEGKLSMIDLRQMRQILSYDGHLTGSRKIPFSINEDLNLLCATGSDNMTKLWSLNKGDLIYSIPPPDDSKRTHSWLLCLDRKWFVALLQGSSLFTYESMS